MERQYPPDLLEKQGQLFFEWRKRQAPFCADGQFIEDGIVHYPTYLHTRPKLLFLLKEPNDPPIVDDTGQVQKREEWNLAKWLGEGAWHQTKSRGYKSWEVVARWTHDITYNDQQLKPWRDLEIEIGQHQV